MANYTVSTLDNEFRNGGNLAAETADGNGLSLREALSLANANGQIDTITFAPSLAGGTAFLDGSLRLTSNLTIDGDIDGDGRPDITLSANSAAGVDDADTRVVLIDGTGTDVTLNGLIIRDGNYFHGGGILLNSGTEVTLSNSVVTGNYSSIDGGGIELPGRSTLTVVNSTIDGNTADRHGGGIEVQNQASLTLINSTVSDNVAENGGGMAIASAGASRVINSTFAGNISTRGGAMALADV
jgi:parallel beta-helix repeat protein